MEGGTIDAAVGGPCRAEPARRVPQTGDIRPQKVVATIEYLFTETIMKLRSTVVFVVGGLLALPLWAQQMGHYAGTLSGGGEVHFDVVDNGAGGVRIDSFGFSYIADCAKTGPGRWVGWGIGGGPDIVDGATSYSMPGTVLHTQYDMVFDSGGTQVSGNFNTYTAEFVNVDKHNSSAQRCMSGQQTFTASYVTDPGFRRAPTQPSIWALPPR